MNEKEKMAAFLELEEKHQLMTREINGVPYWNMVRFSFYYTVTSGKAYLASTHPDTVMNVKQLILNAPRVLWQALTKNHWFNVPEADVMFMLTPRKVETERGPLAILLDYFCDKLDRSFCIFEKPLRYRHLKYKIDRKVLYSDYFEIKRLIYNKLGIGRKEVLKAAAAGEFDFIADFNKTFDSNITMEYMISKTSFCVASYKACFKNFCSLLRRMKAKCLVHAVPYEQENQIMTLAARTLDIPVLELQHGIVNGSHIAYNYKTANLRCQPDKVLTWGDFWAEELVNPRKDAFIPCGFPYFESISKNTDTQAKPKNILIVSQGPFTAFLSGIAIKLHTLLAPHGYKIIFKLHPNQCLVWRQKYPELAKFENEIEVAASPTRGIYSYFDSSIVQIGISSTALLEGLAWNLQTFVLEYDTCGYMEYLYKNNYAFLVKSAEEIAEKLLSGQKVDIPPADFFWTGNAAGNIVEAIKKEIDR